MKYTVVKGTNIHRAFIEQPDGEIRQKGKVRIMKAMEKINAVVKIALASKVDSLHKIGLALEGIANNIEHSVKEVKTADSGDYTFTIWYYRGLIDASLYAFKSIVVCSGLNDTPEGSAVLKIDLKEVK